MIRHCVFMNLRADADPDVLVDAMAGLKEVTERLPGASGFVAGPNRDFEDKTSDYPTGFTIDFTDAAALEAYANDPEHRGIGAQLVRLCQGGADGIAVFDLYAE